MKHTGNVHNYLGIYLDYSGNGKVKVSMIKYLHKLLNEFLEYRTLSNFSATAAKDHLFQIRDKKEA